ncbi:MAG: stage II sporulation protein R [Ruminococcus sp.]|nr:stage II sporulation protein R [Ruminococcus sp.]
MKQFLRVVTAATALSVLIALIPFQNSCEELYSDVFRVHIIPNSNSAYDQSMKLSVRDAVLSAISPLYDGADCKADAMRITQENLPLIEKTANTVVRDSGADYSVTAAIENTYFNTRYYEDFTMPAGWYDALKLTIGEGGGDNFWCVMYPALCVGAATRKELREDLDEGEYEVVTCDDLTFRFKIVEYYERLRACFR